MKQNRGAATLGPDKSILESIDPFLEIMVSSPDFAVTQTQLLLKMANCGNLEGQSRTWMSPMGGDGRKWSILVENSFDLTLLEVHSRSDVITYFWFMMNKSG